MPTSLVSLLQSQLKQLESMHELLAAERDALVKRDLTTTKSLTEQKSEQLQKLQHTDQQITENYSEADLNTPQVKALRVQIDELLIDIKRQNDVNGTIIENSQVTVKMLKEILFASKRDHSSMTYDQLGQKKTRSKYKPIKA